jgi:hypothetical protein
MGALQGFVVATALALVAAIAAAPTVHARAPEVSSSEFEDIGVAASCQGYNVVGHYTVSLKFTTYFNAQGDPIRLMFQGRAKGTLTNSVTGYSVKDAPSIRNGFIDLVTGRQTFVGVDFHITVPGSGVVVLQAGRIVFDGAGPPTFIAGPHLGPPEAQTSALCAALAH